MRVQVWRGEEDRAPGGRRAEGRRGFKGRIPEGSPEERSVWGAGQRWVQSWEAGSDLRQKGRRSPGDLERSRGCTGPGHRSSRARTGGEQREGEPLCHGGALGVEGLSPKGKRADHVDSNEL